VPDELAFDGLKEISPTMAKLDAAAVSKLLRELAQPVELAGGNPYRARAYGRAADNLALSPLPLERLVAEGRLEIPASAMPSPA
jgi:DNA polymerase (family X)